MSLHSEFLLKKKGLNTKYMHLNLAYREKLLHEKIKKRKILEHIMKYVEPIHELFIFT